MDTITALWLFALWFVLAGGFCLGAMWNQSRHDAPHPHDLPEKQISLAAKMYLNFARVYLDELVKAGNLGAVKALSFVSLAVRSLNGNSGPE